MVFRCSVKVDAVHVDQRRSGASTKTMQTPCDALLNHICVPAAEASLTAEDQFQRGIEKLERLGPLVSLLGVVLLGHLHDLPGAPTLIAQGPVFDLLLKDERNDPVHALWQFWNGSDLRCKASHVRSYGEGWHSRCPYQSYSTRPKQELNVSVLVNRTHRPDLSRIESRPVLLEDQLTLIKRASAKVEGQVRLSANNLTPLHELVCSEFITLDADPSQLRPKWWMHVSHSLHSKRGPLTQGSRPPKDSASRGLDLHAGDRNLKLGVSSYLLGRFSLGPTPSIQW